MDEKHGRWSDILVTIIPEELCEDNFEYLQNLRSCHVKQIMAHMNISGTHTKTLIGSGAKQPLLCYH